MSKPKIPSAAQKKKRLVQLREAQRRRRERLKSDSRHFVQIILSEAVLSSLQAIISETGETMQQIIARLVTSSLPVEKINFSISDPTQELTELGADLQNPPLEQFSKEEFTEVNPNDSDWEAPSERHAEPVTYANDESLSEEIALIKDYSEEEAVLDMPRPGQLDLFG